MSTVEELYGPVPDGYLIREFARSGLTEDDVVDLWLREGAISAEEAARRVREAFAVAVGPSGDVVGVATVYLRHSPRFRMAFWVYRVYVAAAHRRSRVAVHLAATVRAALEERYVSGRDTRGHAMLMEVENLAVRAQMPEAVWPPDDTYYLGVDENGRDIRITWFEGAEAPLPEESTS